MAIQSWLVRTEHHTILIDTCMGCDKDSEFAVSPRLTRQRGGLK